MPVRVAVELVTSTGERDTSFDGYVTLELHGDMAQHERPQQRHKVQCHLGLCLWNHLALNGPPGQHRLKAIGVDQSVDMAPDKVLLGEAPEQVAFSAPIVFKKLAIPPRPHTDQAGRPSRGAEVERGDFLW